LSCILYRDKFYIFIIFLPDDMMGVHLKVKEEVEKKKAENISTGEELLPLTNEMIISSCMQVLINISQLNIEQVIFHFRNGFSAV